MPILEPLPVIESRLISQRSPGQTLLAAYFEKEVTLLHSYRTAKEKKNGIRGKQVTVTLSNSPPFSTGYRVAVRYHC